MLISRKKSTKKNAMRKKALKRMLCALLMSQKKWLIIDIDEDKTAPYCVI